MADNIDNRLQALEELCAHQGAEIESLSDLVKEQWEQIDLLTKSIMRLLDRMTETEERADTPHINTKPPHY